MTYTRVAFSSLLLLLVAASAAANPPSEVVTPPTPPATPAPDPDAPALNVTAVGDIMLGTTFPHETNFLSPGNGAELLEPMHAAIQAGDVRFGNLEGPLVDGGSSDKCPRSGNCYAFRSPTAYGEYLKAAGFTVMSLANNHAHDFGEEGRASSERTLDALGIKHSGRKGTVAELDVNGLEIALIAYHTADHSNYLNDLPTMRETIAKLAQSHDLVFVSFHGGSEGSKADRTPDEPEFLGSEPRGNVIAFAHQAVDAGADLVLGHGPHVLRGMEYYRGRLIAYSLGNFATYGRFNLRGKLGYAAVLRATLARDGRFLSGKLTPAIQPGRGGPQPDPKGHAIAEVDRLTRLDFPDTGVVVKKDGTLEPPGTAGAGLFTVDTPELRAKVKDLVKDLMWMGKLKHAEVVRWVGDPRAEYLPEVPKRFQRPAEKKWTFERYRKIFITDERVAEGHAWKKEQEALLTEAANQYGVDEAALAAVVAVETRYGTHKGKFPAFNALASVVLGYPRRAPWAARELAALISIYRDKDPLVPMGSYAGAVGYPQFMPTSIQAYAVDADGDSWINLESWKDAIHSCANYLKRHGWKNGVPIKKGSKTYRAIYKYNNSHFYVRVVGELAELFGYEPKALTAPKKPEKAKTPARKAPARAGEKK